MERKRYLVGLIAAMAAFVLLSIGGVREASAEEVHIIPRPQLMVGTGISGWRPSSCQCVDRMRWDTEFTAGLRWHHLIQVEGGLDLGGVLFPKSGYFPYVGWTVGYRAHVVPPPREWWQDFFVRTGYSRISLDYTRMDHIEGGYLRGGWSLHIWGPLHADTELGFAYYTGVMRNLQFGGRGVLRLAF